jgi:energy-coupling factor transport system permease protein
MQRNIPIAKALKNIHPAVKLYIWVCMAISVQILSPQALLLLFSLLIIVVFRIARQRFIHLIRRTRWILISILIIYSYTSPGVLMWDQIGVLSPKTDGIILGTIQLARLLLVISGLAILLTVISRTQLLIALYTWFKPLEIIGVSRQRLAMRLALTIEYAEKGFNASLVNWQDSLEEMLAKTIYENSYIELEFNRFKLIDYAVMFVMTIALFGVWL